MKKIAKMLNKIQISDGFIFGCLGVIIAAFIPIAILLLENGVETRIDRLVIINDLLNFKLFFGMLFLLVLVTIVKVLEGNEKTIVAKIFNVGSLVLLLCLLLCSFMICQNTISWLNDVPVSISTDIAYTSNPTLDSMLPINREQAVAIRPKELFGYKKKARMSYIESANSIKEQELRWEIFFNDADTYKYEGGNDFWVYVWRYYSFLGSITDDDEDIALRGFASINAHIKNIGASVNDYTCSYLFSTLFQLKLEETDWRAKMWASLVGRYMVVALMDVDIYEDTRACWLGSLPEFLMKDGLGVGDDNHLKILANAIWDAFNSFEVQYSEYRAMFYPDVPQYIVDFYTTLSKSKSAEDFYKYIKSKNLESYFSA